MRARSREGGRGDPRVGVPAEYWDLDPRTGHGRVWHRVLSELERLADVAPIKMGANGRPRLGRRRPRSPDVWLASGHAGALPVEEPVVASVHEAGWVRAEQAAFAPEPFLAVLKPLTNAGIGSADHVLTPSESARSEVLAGYSVPANRVSVVPYGVDTALYRPGVTGGRALVAHARAGEDAPYVLFAGRPYDRKNVPALRDAMARLKGRGFGHVLVIAGGPLDGPGAEETMARLQADLPGGRGRLTWLKDVTDAQLVALMAEADVFCLPSFSEGFGLTALEAMACGVPVVVSSGGALPEVVGQAGLVVEPTATGLERGLASVLEDAGFARRLGTAGRARAETFTWRRTAEGWFDALCRAAAGRPGCQEISTRRGRVPE